MPERVELSAFPPCGRSCRSAEAPQGLSREANRYCGLWLQYKAADYARDDLGQRDLQISLRRFAANDQLRNELSRKGLLLAQLGQCAREMVSGGCLDYCYDEAEHDIAGRESQLDEHSLES